MKAPRTAAPGGTLPARILILIAAALLLRPAAAGQETLRPSVVVESPLDSVAVYAGTSFVGYAPARLAVACGEPTFLRCEKRGRVPWNDTLRACADTTISVRLPLPATLRISSEPESARVHINGAFAGITPLEITGLPPDSVAISVTKPLCEPWYASLAPPEGILLPIMARLPKRFATISILSNRPGTALYLDDTLRTTGPLLNYRVRFGAHSLRARDDADGREAAMMFTVVDGRPLSFHAELGVRSTQRAVFAALLPGSAQLSDGDAVEGIAMMIGAIALGANAVLAQGEYGDSRDRYDAALASYVNAPTETEADRRHADLQARKDELDSHYAYRTVSFAGFAAGYLYALIDAYRHHLTIDGIEILPLQDLRGGPGNPPPAPEPGIRVRVGL